MIRIGLDKASRKFFLVKKFTTEAFFSDVREPSIAFFLPFQFIAFPSEVRTAVRKTTFSEHRMIHRHVMPEL